MAQNLAQKKIAAMHDAGVMMAYRAAEESLRTSRSVDLRIAADNVKRAAAAEILRRGLSLR